MCASRIATTTATIILLASALAGCGGGSSVSSAVPQAQGAQPDVVPPPPTDPNYLIPGGGSSTVAAGAARSLGMPAWSIANGDKLSYSWTLSSKPAGSNAALTSANAAQAGITPDLPGSYVASLVVSDGKRLSMPATTTVNAIEATAFKGFVDLVNNGGCNQWASDLYLVDGKYVFADIAGNCPDASYSAGLYGLTPAQRLCGVSDSIAGPQRQCPDASVAALFDTIYAHRNLSDLGLGSAHQVSKFVKPAPVPAGATAVNFTIIDQGPSSAAYSSAPATAVVRTNADWSALWLAYKGGSPAFALPPVDFSKNTVLALSYPQITSCMTTGVTSVYVLDGKLVVEYAVRPASAADTACLQYVYFAAELISIDLADPSLPVVFQKTN